MSRFEKVRVAGWVSAAALVVFAAAALAARQPDAAGPLTAGRCYRTTFLDPAQQHIVRVLENPVGAWVRVQSEPFSPRVPGAPARARVWLNTSTVFAITEMECSSFPGN